MDKTVANIFKQVNGIPVDPEWSTWLHDQITFIHLFTAC